MRVITVSFLVSCLFLCLLLWFFSLRPGADGQAALRNFVQLGGSIYASGKAAVILESIGILSTGTVQSDKMLGSRRGIVSAFHTFMTVCQAFDVLFLLFFCCFS